MDNTEVGFNYLRGEINSFLNEGVGLRNKRIKSLLQCIDDDGNVDDTKFYKFVKYKQQKQLDDELDNNLTNCMEDTARNNEDEDKIVNNNKKTIRTPRTKRSVFVVKLTE